MPPLLLKGGIVLQHKNNDNVLAVKADILVEGNVISKIEPEIASSPFTKVIDCRDKIISPGLIDTHRHLWQTQLKARHGNHLLMDYMLHGNAMESMFSADDARLGALAGALESIDAGTTTVVDHTHIVRSPEHLDAILEAVTSSGIRAVVCPAVVSHLEQWQPTIKFKPSPLADWFLDAWDSAADKVAANEDDRIKFGLSFDGWSLPLERIQEVFAHVRGYKHQSHLVTSHVSWLGHPAKAYQKAGVLAKDILASHPNELDHETVELIKRYDIYGSSTPSTELQMNLGRPTALREDLYRHSSLGIDCHTATNSSIIEQARLLLQWARAAESAKYLDAGKQTELPGVVFTVEQAFNLATIHGARAARLDDVGSIAVGKKADLVIFNAMSPTMICGARHNPLTAVVMHSIPRDIETVIVDGVIRKDGGVLLPVEIDGRWKTWPDLAEELVASYEALQERIAALQLEKRGGEYLQAVFAAHESTNT